MAAIDTVAAGVNTAGASFATATPAAGDSLAVRNFPDAASAWLFGVRSQHVTSAQPFRIRSPLLHDNVQGLRFYPQETTSPGELDEATPQRLYPQDVLTVEASTAPATGVAEIVLATYYESLPGASARLYAPGDVDGLIRAIKPVLVTLTAASLTFNAWAGAALDSVEALLHANTDYAVLGYTTDQPLAAVAVRGIDTANLRVSGPGTTRHDLTRSYFRRLSYVTGLPCIPVINSANVGATFVDAIAAAAPGANPSVVLILGELAQRLG
ncbi:MAG TPA: hypothetical protein VNJ28_04680 [Candidatus Limnocylindrales bacterium]|nr:hypothetical protein [Candidatus Limnocylindrales bacterium]